MCLEIHKLITSIWEREKLPEEWKESVIVTIHKKGDKTDCNNYRGISLLPTTCLKLNGTHQKLNGTHQKLNGTHQKLNGTHQLLAYADDINILGGSIHSLKENAEALVAATREIGLGVLIKLSTWPCLEIRMQDEVNVRGLIIVPSRGCKSLNIWEQL